MSEREFYIPFRVLPPHISFLGKEWPQYDESVGHWSNFCARLEVAQWKGPIKEKVSIPCGKLTDKQIEIALRDINARNYIGTLSDDKQSIDIEPRR